MSTPTPGASPLVEQLDSAVTEIHITPGFGNRLQLVFHSSTGMPEPLEGALAAVTVYGDGRIEYHPADMPGEAS
jgi:hypothetical protein